jgi:hypothetical protein
MAVTLEANYCKKIGLPGYSSHQYSLTVRTEVADLAQIQRESEQLHATLQTSVDNELRSQGWLPGSDAEHAPSNNGNGAWKCSAKQKELILKLAEEHKLDLDTIEDLAQARFGMALRELNKLNASSIIDELLARQGNTPNRNNGNGRYARSGGPR